MDGNKISHVDPEVVTKLIDIMKIFGELVIYRGKIHIFLGMDIMINN